MLQSQFQALICAVAQSLLLFLDRFPLSCPASSSPVYLPPPLCMTHITRYIRKYSTAYCEHPPSILAYSPSILVRILRIHCVSSRMRSRIRCVSCVFSRILVYSRVFALYPVHIRVFSRICRVSCVFAAYSRVFSRILAYSSRVSCVFAAYSSAYLPRICRVFAAYPCVFAAYSCVFPAYPRMYLVI